MGYQLLRLDVDELHLIRLVKHGIRDALPGGVAGDGAYGVVEAFNITQIDCGVYVNTGVQKILHILIPAAVTAAGGIGVSQLVHQNQLRLSGEGGVQVKFFLPV